MKRLLKVVLGLFIVLLLPLIACAAENDTLIIAVTNEADARNAAVEEAFLERNPNAEIQYRLYSDELLSTLLLANQADFDLLIASYQTLSELGTQGYLTELYKTLAIPGWPEALLDLSKQLENEKHELFALPVSIAQSFWGWNDELASVAGISCPAKSGIWTWDAYSALAASLPQDINGDGVNDVYLKGGMRISSIASFDCVDGDALTNYVTMYPGVYDDSFIKFLDEFEQFFRSPGLLSLDLTNSVLFNDMPAVLIAQYSIDNPITVIDGGHQGYSFLPPPLFSEKDVRYCGTVTGCALMLSAPHPQLAREFLSAMLSDKALSVAVGNNETTLLSRKAPAAIWLDENDVYAPLFLTREGSVPAYKVPRNRAFSSIPFPYSNEAFEQSQAFRQHVTMSEITLGRAFYDACWELLFKWDQGGRNHEEFARSMRQLYKMATEE